jgi:hypothetical protein
LQKKNQIFFETEQALTIRACPQGHESRAVRLLLAAGARPDAIHPTQKTTALEAARVRLDPALISLLTSAVDHK